MIRHYGIIVGPKEVGKEIRLIAARINAGRAMKISLKRPSPQMSRKRLELIGMQARLNVIAKRRH